MLAHNEPVLIFIISILQESQNYLHGNIVSFESIMFINHFIYNEHFIYFNQILQTLCKNFYARMQTQKKVHHHCEI